MPALPSTIINIDVKEQKVKLKLKIREIIVLSRYVFQCA